MLLESLNIALIGLQNKLRKALFFNETNQETKWANPLSSSSETFEYFILYSLPALLFPILSRDTKKAFAKVTKYKRDNTINWFTVIY